MIRYRQVRPEPNSDLECTLSRLSPQQKWGAVGSTQGSPCVRRVVQSDPLESAGLDQLQAQPLLALLTAHESPDEGKANKQHGPYRRLGHCGHGEIVDLKGVLT